MPIQPFLRGCINKFCQQAFSKSVSRLNRESDAAETGKTELLRSVIFKGRPICLPDESRGKHPGLPYGHSCTFRSTACAIACRYVETLPTLVPVTTRCQDWLDAFVDYSERNRDWSALMTELSKIIKIWLTGTLLKSWFQLVFVD